MIAIRNAAVFVATGKHIEEMTPFERGYFGLKYGQQAGCRALRACPYRYGTEQHAKYVDGQLAAVEDMDRFGNALPGKHKQRRSWRDG